MRLTVRDPEKTVSFTGDDTLARGLVAACVAEPTRLEDMLIAVEDYAPGAASHVMRDLIAFDAGHSRRQGPGQTGQTEQTEQTGQTAGDEDTLALPTTVEVVDPPTERLSMTPDAGGLLVFDLPRKAIEGRTDPARDPITAQGVLNVTTASGDRREIAYVLGTDWTLRISHERLEQARLRPQPVAAPEGELIGMGERTRVYRAADAESQRPVAVKRFDARVESDRAFTVNFRGDAQRRRSLDHPNVLGTLSYGRDDDGYYLITEYIDGGNLARHLTGGAQPAASSPLVLRALGEACAGLHYLHLNGLLHGNLKGTNILLRASGAAVVADPRSRYQLDGGTLHGDALTLADAATVSPEAVVGAALTPASDIYSMGVLLYQVCTGQRPIFAPNPLTMAWRHVHDEPPRPRTIAPFLDGDLEAVILRCLDKDPARRYSTMAELKDALARWIPSPGNAAAPPALSPAIASDQTGPSTDLADGGSAPAAGKRTPRDGAPSAITSGIHEADTLVASPLSVQSPSDSDMDGALATAATALAGGPELKRLAPIREANLSGDGSVPHTKPRAARGRADGDDRALEADHGASAKDGSPWLGLRQLSQRVLGGPLGDHPLDAKANTEGPEGPAPRVEGR